MKKIILLTYSVFKTQADELNPDQTEIIKNNFVEPISNNHVLSNEAKNFEILCKQNPNIELKLEDIICTNGKNIFELAVTEFKIYLKNISLRMTFNNIADKLIIKRKLFVIILMLLKSMIEEESAENIVDRKIFQPPIDYDNIKNQYKKEELISFEELVFTDPNDKSKILKILMSNELKDISLVNQDTIGYVYEQIFGKTEEKCYKIEIKPNYVKLYPNVEFHIEYKEKNTAIIKFDIFDKDLNHLVLQVILKNFYKEENLLFCSQNSSLIKITIFGKKFKIPMNEELVCLKLYEISNEFFEILPKILKEQIKQIKEVIKEDKASINQAIRRLITNYIKQMNKKTEEKIVSDVFDLELFKAIYGIKNVPIKMIEEVLKCKYCSLPCYISEMLEFMGKTLQINNYLSLNKNEKKLAIVDQLFLNYNQKFLKFISKIDVYPFHIFIFLETLPFINLIIQNDEIKQEIAVIIKKMKDKKRKNDASLFYDILKEIIKKIQEEIAKENVLKKNTIESLKKLMKEHVFCEIIIDYGYVLPSVKEKLLLVQSNEKSDKNSDEKK